MSAPSAAPRSYADLLRSREYVGLLISRLISLVGDQLGRVALTVLVYQRTGSAFLSAATFAVTFLPVVVGGPLLGGLADRLPRRRLLITADLLRAALFALMALPGVPLPVLLGLVLLASTAEGPWNAARTPLLRDILRDDDGYQRGSGLDETLDQSGNVIGYAAAGLLLVVFEPRTALLLDALTFLASALVIRTMLTEREVADLVPVEGRRRSLRAGARRGLADARVGLAAALAPGSRRPLLLTWVGISLVIAPEALATPWAAELGGGPGAIGLLFAASPAGSVLGLLLLARTTADRGQRLLVPMTVLALAPLVLCLAGPPLPVALALIALSGVGSAYSLLARVAFVRATHGPHRGRAFAVASAGVTAGQGLGIALAGVLAAWMQPSRAVGLLGLLGLVLVPVVLLLSRPAAPVVEHRPRPALDARLRLSEE